MTDSILFLRDEIDGRSSMILLGHIALQPIAKSEMAQWETLNLLSSSDSPPILLLGTRSVILRRGVL
jgi:hypothetical protein